MVKVAFKKKKNLFFFLGMGRRQKTRIDLGKSYGVTKYQYEKLDDVELLCKIGFLINCEMIDRCRSCRHLLKFCIKILLKRWDEIRFINFYDAFKVVRSYKDFFKRSDFLQHWREKRHIVKNLLREYRVKKNALDLIDRHHFLFEESIYFLNILLFIFWSCFLPKFPNSLKGVLYTSSIAPRIIFGAMLSTSAPPVLIA